MLIHLPIIILTSLHPTAAANAVPQFDIVRECHGEGGTKQTEQRCTTDEMNARDHLRAEWAGNTLRTLPASTVLIWRQETFNQ
jgi:hypothetical protein